MRRLSVVLGLLAVLLVGVAAPALAAAPLNVTGRITDQVGALKGDDQAVSSAIDDLQAKTGINEYVIFVSSFDGMNGQQWVEQTAQQSGLTGNDVVLAVAVGDKHYGVHPGNVSSAEMNRIVVDQVKPKLSDGDWAGAATALASGLSSGAGNATSSDSTRSSSSGLTTFLVVVGLIVVVGGLYMFGRFRRRRRQEAEVEAAHQAQLQKADPYAGTSTEQLNYQASSALLDLDERVRTAQVNGEYARSYFGAEAVPGFEEGLARSRDELAKAFTIRQLLDDDIPEDEPTTRRMLADLLKLTGSAGDRLKAQAATLDELRERERTAPQAAEELGRRIAELQARMPAQEQKIADLQRRYAAGAVAPVTQNVREAGVRLTAAEQGLALARQDQASGQVGRSVGRLRGAEDAAGQSATLLDAIDRLAADLVSAEQRVAAARAEIDADLAEARSLAGAGDRSGLPPLIARAEAARTAADAALHASPPDPLTALRQLEEADASLEQALSVARDAQPQARRAAEALQPALLTARSAVAAADDFIGTRRGAVGPTARTRLAEAARHLDAAESQARQDPQAALNEARDADRLARFALEVAQNDVAEWSQQTGYGGYGGGFGGGGYGGGWGGGGWGGRGWGGGGWGGRRGMSPLGAGLGGLLLGGLLFGDHDGNNGDWSSGDWTGGGGWDGGGGGDFGGDFGGGGGDFGGDF